MNVYHHTATPTLSVIDPRTLTVRSVGYCRHPDSPEIAPRITRQRFDAAGRLVESWDPRLWGTAPKPNLTTVYGLSGQPLLTDSVDAGWQLSVLDQVGLPLSFWDARGSQRHTEFDEQQRPVTVTEQDAGERPRVVERLTYGGLEPAYAAHNQCGQVIRHDRPAGTHWAADYGLAGSVLVEEQRLLLELETPDWPPEFDARDEYLEAQSFITRHTFNPTGELQEQTDAMGNVRTFGYDVAGKLSEAWLQMAGENKQPQSLVNDIRYNAQDQVERETAGNGVLTHVEYAAEDGRLIRLMAALGNQTPLQDLNYAYDPVGNIVELHDQSQAVTHFNNQRIDPINRYRYDSLYQLVEAQGWEVSQPSHGPALPTLLPTPLDPNQRRNYTQRFEYDRGGNLITRQHSDAPGFSMFTSAQSNRSLAQRDDGSLPGEPDIDSGFDAGGNQQELQRGQAMAWDIRNQLSRVTLVKRETEPDDYECYRYDRPGHRLRKTGFAHSSGRTQLTEVRYLPGLEIHRQADGEEHHVISVEAGRSSVRALHWPEGAHSDQLRYSLSDHLGSSTLELDDEAGVLTQEHYYPFGGTACWAGKSALVAQYKTIRYSGKERDATGLYYYGYRYYAPWLQCWICPDPAGPVNGLNIFCFVSNKCVSVSDVDGRYYPSENDQIEREIIPSGSVIVARGLHEFSSAQSSSIRSELLGAMSFFSGAQNAVHSGYMENTNILQGYFSQEYSSVMSKVLESMRRGEGLAREYHSPRGHGKFLGFSGGGENINARVHAWDFYGRIAINVSPIGDVPFRAVLGHELLHLNRSSGMVTIGPNSVDHFYLNHHAQWALNSPVRQYEIPQQGISEVIMGGGLTMQYLKAFTSDHRDFIFTVGEYMSKMHPGIVFKGDLEDAVEFFNVSPNLRARMASENSDSITFAAISLHRLNQTRVADSQLLYGLLSS